MNSRLIAIHDRDFYALSLEGVNELREAGTTLSATHLQIMVLIDGRTTVTRIASRLGLSIEVARGAFAECTLRRGRVRRVRTRHPAEG